jgi:cyclase
MRAAARPAHGPSIRAAGGTRKTWTPSPGRPQDFLRVLTDGEADAALAASVFHYGTLRIADLKEYLDRHGIPVRRV